MKISSLLKTPIMEQEIAFGDLFCSAFTSYPRVYFCLERGRAFHCLLLVKATDKTTFTDISYSGRQNSRLIPPPNDCFYLDEKYNSKMQDETFPIVGFEIQTWLSDMKLNRQWAPWILLERFSVEELLVSERDQFREYAKKFMTSKANSTIST